MRKVLLLSLLIITMPVYALSTQGLLSAVPLKALHRHGVNADNEQTIYQAADVPASPGDPVWDVAGNPGDVFTLQVHDVSFFSSGCSNITTFILSIPPVFTDAIGAVDLDDFGNNTPLVTTLAPQTLSSSAQEVGTFTVLPAGLTADAQAAGVTPATGQCAAMRVSVGLERHTGGNTFDRVAGVNRYVYCNLIADNGSYTVCLPYKPAVPVGTSTDFTIYSVPRMAFFSGDTRISSFDATSASSSTVTLKNIGTADFQGEGGGDVNIRLGNLLENFFDNTSTCIADQFTSFNWDSATQTSCDLDTASPFPDYNSSPFTGEDTIFVNGDESGEYYQQIALGASVMREGYAKCWGSGSDGKVGDDTTDSKTITTNVDDTSGSPTLQTNQLSTGGTFSCANQSGTVYCWGKNDKGQLGINTATAQLNRPTSGESVGSISTATQIAAGYDHACALLANGTVQCWGDNSQGELGADLDPSTTFSATPQTVKIRTGESGGNPVLQTLTDVTKVVSGYRYSCAIVKGKSVVCWGSNSRGQLGDGVFGSSRGYASAVALNPLNILFAGALQSYISDTYVNDIVAGYQHVCLLTDGDALYCWGDNTQNEINKSPDTEVTLPALVAFGDLSPLPDVFSAASVAMGYHSTCLTDSQSGGVYCYGDNSHGQLGDGSTTTRSDAELVHLPSILFTAAKNISCTTDFDDLGVPDGSHCCAVEGELAINNDKGYCWGSNPSNELGVVDESAPQVTIPSPILKSRGPNTEDNSAMVFATSSHNSCALATSANS